MSYRGRDLDLYTSEQTRAGRTAGRASGRGPAFQRGNADGYVGSSLPDLDGSPGDDTGMLVDDAVLTVCNHAYDLAVAHRSSEVRLEHLLNAMTRTDAAVAVMSALGIDVAGLRYDTASAIAAQEAMISGNERNSPRRSQDLADTLAFAGERARARRSSVSIADMLHTLFELNRERPVLEMLRRNAPGWQPRLFEAPRQEPLQPMLGAYQPEPRYAPQPEPPRDYQRSQPVSYYSSAPAAPVIPPAPTLTDAVQNSRIDQLERTIRELSGELTAERKAFSQLVGDLKRDVFSHNDTAMRMRGGLDDRLAGIEQMMMELRGSAGVSGGGPQMADRFTSLERSVEAKFGEVARGWSVLGERLQSLETAVSNDRQTEPPVMLMERLRGLDDIARAMASFADRMTSLEREIATRPQTTAVPVNLQPVLDRLAAIEHAQQERAAAMPDLLAPIMAKLAAIEGAAAKTAVADFSPMLEHLNMIDSRVADVGRDAASFIERVERFERKIDSAGERLVPIEDELAAQHDQLAQLATNLASDVKSIGQALTAQDETNERLQSAMVERFQGVTQAFERQRGDLLAAVAGPLGDRVGRVEQLVETHRHDLGAQIAVIEKQVEGFGRRTIDLHEAHGKDILELHDEIVKLNTNQHTLASSLDQWRLDIGGKLEGLERGSVRPLQMLESLQGNVQSLQASIVRREERRSRWQHWLMGTDDWYAASWDTPKSAGAATNGNGAAARGDQGRPAPSSQPGKQMGPYRS